VKCGDDWRGTDPIDAVDTRLGSERRARILWGRKLYPLGCVLSVTAHSFFRLIVSERRRTCVHHDGVERSAAAGDLRAAGVRRRDVLGGLVHECRAAA
jgi:hypothetical protein